jgi:quercetin dioxygenase-like cupin family protein
MSRYERIPDFIKSLPEVDFPFPGARGWMIAGPEQQVVFVEFAQTVSVPEHSHDAQWEFAIAGKVEMTIDGASQVYGAGDNFFIPKGTPHAATVHAGYQAMMVFDAPDRYRAKGLLPDR